MRSTTQSVIAVQRIDDWKAVAACLYDSAWRSHQAAEAMVIARLYFD